MRIIRLILASVLLAACGKQSAPATHPATASAPTPAAKETHTPAPSGVGIIPGSQEGESAESLFDPKNYPNAAQGTFVDPKKLTATERKYGMAPKRDVRVTYQDGLILMEHGDEAIREAKTDGMTFTFDAKAEHVDEFAEGKIIFATGRVVGRVGQLTRNGDTVTVKLAPVQITEIVKKGTFMMHSDFSPKDLIIYMAPDFPNTIDVAATQQSDNLDPEPSEPQYLRAGLMKTALPSLLNNDMTTIKPWMPDTGNEPTLDLPSAGIKVAPAIGSDGGIGINFSYVKNGVIFNAYGQMVVPAPHVDFLLDIDSSGIKTFGIQITGSVTLRTSIEATSDIDQYINVNSTTATPLDFSLPCPIAGLPLALSFSTTFNLHTKFAAKRSTLTSSGSWNLNGTLFAGYKNGSQSHQTPPSQESSPLIGNVSGISLGINRIGVAMRIAPMIGLGGFGFMTGVYMGVSFSADVAKSGTETWNCHVASGGAHIDSGVGYRLPSSLVDLLNKVLKLFNYQIEKGGTLIHGWGGDLFRINQDIPEHCGGFGTAPAKT
ncbi:MAG TPA: hypothetical protein VIY68_02185 [Steroidobacteraceae bacterium]